MDKYEKIEVVGEGSYGVVLKCRHRESGQVVAIKKFLETEEDNQVRKMALREIRMLKKLRHDNLVSMIEVFRRNRRYFLVFEYMDHTILDELEENTSGLGDEISRQHIYQVIRGIDYCHNNKVLHRDVKPENVLVSRLGVIKLCDFGFARLLATQGETYTDYVATRWYRAPELLVGDTKYGREVDIWAIGCLYTEMMTGDPLFPGDSDIDQLYQITKLLGKLSQRHQQILARNPMFKGMKKAADEGAMRSLSKTFPTWPYLALDLASICLKMDPALRPNSRELLHHPYFLHDNFTERFIPEVQLKVQQEFQSNPLLRGQSNLILAAAAARRSRDRVIGESGDASNKSLSYLQRRGSFMEPPRWKINLATEYHNLSNGDSRRISVEKPKPIPAVPRRRLSDNANVTSKMEVTEDNNNDIRQDVFKNTHNTAVFYTKSKTMQDPQPSPVVDVSPPSPSPPPFQSLQTSIYTQTSNFSVNSEQCSFPQSHANSMQVLHPSINNLSFGVRESLQNGHHLVTGNINGNMTGGGTSILGKTMEPLKRSPQPLANRPKEKAVFNPSLVPRTHLIRRLDRTLFVDVSHVDKTQVNLGHESPPSNEKWMNGRKLGPVRSNENAAWRANKTTTDDFTLPNVPGASGSPSKVTKKKLNALNHHPTGGDPFISPDCPYHCTPNNCSRKKQKRINLDLPLPPHLQHIRQNV